MWLPTFYVPCLSFAVFPNLWFFDISVKALNPSSPLCFSTHLSGCFIISMTPWRICSALRSTLQSIFCIIRVFQHVRPAGLFRAASVVVFCLCLLPWFFTPTANCPRFSLILIFFFRPFFRSSFSLLLLPSFFSTRSHSLPTVVQRTHKRLYHVRIVCRLAPETTDRHGRGRNQANAMESVLLREGREEKAEKNDELVPFIFLGKRVWHETLIML